MKNNSPAKGEDETLDSFYQGRILVLQKKRGYRFSVDAPILADFIQTNSSDELLELGAGSGIISLLLSQKPFQSILALEIQESLADLARRNVSLNNLESKIFVIQEDLRSFHPGRKFDVIFSNPPYIKRRGGHLSHSLEKSIAKHELECDIFDIMRKTGELLKEEGRAYFIYSAKRKEDFVAAAEQNGFKVKRLRSVLPRSGSVANFMLAECRFSSQEIEILPPLVLYDERGKYTEEVGKIFSGGTSV